MSFGDYPRCTSPDGLRFRLYERALHPEWLTVSARRRVRYAGHTISAGILSGGHVFQWHRGDTVLTEVLAPEADLPSSGLLLHHAAEHGRRAKWKLSDGLRFDTSCSIERLSPDEYRIVHAELIHDGARAGLVYHFPNHGRVGMGPLGYLTVEAVPAGLVFSAFHTFPDRFAVVKTITLIDFAQAPVPARRSED